VFYACSADRLNCSQRAVVVVGAHVGPSPVKMVSGGRAVAVAVGAVIVVVVVRPSVC